MDHSEKVTRLKRMLSQVSEGRLESVLRLGPVFRGDVIEESAADFQPGPERVVSAALEKLDDDREHDLTQEEAIVLEAIVLPRERPVVFVRGTSFDDVEPPWTHLNDADVHSRFASVLTSIGRIELPGAPWLPYGGTGFVVGRDLIMTNRHVAALVTEGLGTRLRYRAGDAGIDFKREIDTPDGDRSALFSVRGVIMIHPFWDMALMRTDGLEAIPPLTLAVDPPDDQIGSDVLVVGYPARDPRNDLDLQDQIFQGKYDIKRAQPGKLRERVQVRSFQNRVRALVHDSSTLGGNSGSAILNVATGEVLGLHFAGEYLKANYGVPMYELARDPRLKSAGLNFAGKVAPTGDFEPAWRLAEGIDHASEPPPGGSDNLQSPTAAPPPALSLDGGSVSLTIPLRITVSLGQPSFPSAGDRRDDAVLTESFPMAPPKIYGGLEHRKGYSATFLRLTGGSEVPLPELTPLGRSVAAKLDDGSHELKYHKFSAVVHKGRRMALFTASNVDWRPASRLINGRKPTRKELTELPDRTMEEWVADWRIPAQHQLPDVFYTKDGGAFDKGHLVRRDDVAWGSSFRDMQKANGDTYHVTNCSPQRAAFNRPKKSDEINNWGDLETMVQQQTKAERASIFAGPVFEEDDPLFEGRDSSGRTRVRIPRKFWKIIVTKGALGPEAFGFVLEQDLTGLRTVEEMAVPPQWRREMRSIEAIEELLHGLAEFAALKPYDQFEINEGVRSAAFAEAGGD